MAYSTVSKKSKKTYYLHSKVVTLKGGQKQTIYYFAGAASTGAINALPAGYQVVENERTGLPLLKKATSPGAAKATTPVAARASAPTSTPAATRRP